MAFELGPKQKAWIAALRSGEFERGVHALKTNRGYCALGVACVVLGLEFKQTQLGNWLCDGEEIRMPDHAWEELGLRNGAGHARDGSFCHSIARISDDGESFEMIADVLEAAPETYFVRAA